jgi:phosphopantetheinyl transferase
VIAEFVPVTGASDVPQVRLLDAGLEGLGRSALRLWARAETAASGAPYVSRSYRYPYALVAWHAASVGVDIERIETCEAAFARSICTPSELAGLAKALDPALYATTLWCSKEALSKALGNAVDYDPCRLDAPSRWPGGRAGRWHAQPLWVVAAHSAWICWQSSSG